MFYDPGTGEQHMPDATIDRQARLYRKTVIRRLSCVSWPMTAGPNPVIKRHGGVFVSGVLVVAICLVMLSAERASADPGGATLPSIGTLDEYVHQTQIGTGQRGPRYPRQNNGRAYNSGRDSAYRVSANPAIMGVLLLTLWAVQRYDARHNRHHAANYRPAPGRIHMR
jgi:hypothetical protein